MITENLLDVVECAISDYKHIAKEPISLSCGHCICKECIPEGSVEVICFKCNIVNKNNLGVSGKSLGVQYCIEEKVHELLEQAKSKFETKTAELLGNIKKSIFNILKNCLFEDMAENLQEIWMTKRDFIKDEIDQRIESLKYELDNIRDAMFIQVDKEYDSIK